MPKAREVPPVPRAIQDKLGARIKELREGLALSQEVFGERIGISQKYVSELECGRKSPSWAALVSLAHNGCNVKLAALLFGIDEEISAEVQNIIDLIAGRPKEARRLVIDAVKLLLSAGGISATPSPATK